MSNRHLNDIKELLKLVLWIFVVIVGYGVVGALVVETMKHG